MRLVLIALSLVFVLVVYSCGKEPVSNEALPAPSITVKQVPGPKGEVCSVAIDGYGHVESCGCARRKD